MNTIRIAASKILIFNINFNKYHKKICMLPNFLKNQMKILEKIIIIRSTFLNREFSDRH